MFAWDDHDPREAEGAGASGGASSASSGTTMGPGSGGAPGTGGTPSSGGSPATGAGGTGGMGSVAFLDDFDRADDPAIGNGWVEKTPTVFALEGNQIVKNISGPGYQDNLVFRPAAETLLDVEASVEFELTSTFASRPQLLARLQYATALDAGAYDGYKIWINGTDDQALVSRQNGGGSSSQLASITIAPPLAQGTRYRMRLRVEGANPVQLEGFIEQQVGNSWTVIGSNTVSDGSALRHGAAGAVGFAANTDSLFVLDKFRYLPL
jgi:hypothetical protein